MFTLLIFPPPHLQCSPASPAELQFPSESPSKCASTHLRFHLRHVHEFRHMRAGLCGRAHESRSHWASPEAGSEKKEGGGGAGRVRVYSCKFRWHRFPERLRCQLSGVNQKVFPGVSWKMRSSFARLTLEFITNGDSSAPKVFTT